MEMTEQQSIRKTTYYQNNRGEVVAKACRVCGEMKPLEAFTDHPKGLGGKNPHCRTCRQLYDASPHGKAHTFMRRQKFRIKATEEKIGREIPNTMNVLHVQMEYGADECIYCGKPLEPHEVVLDHPIPYSRGGSNDITNLLACCRSCNARKHSKPLYDFLLEYCNADQIQQVIFTLAQRQGITYEDMFERIQAEALKKVN